MTIVDFHSFTPIPPEAASVQPGADGNYTSASLPAGTYWVSVRANFADVVDGVYSPDGSGQRSYIDLSSGGTRTGVDITLEAAGHITGSVSLPVGVNPADIEIYAAGTNGGEGNAYLTDGHFDIGHLKSDTYTVSFFSTQNSVASQFYNGVAAKSAATPVQIGTGQTVRNINAALTVPATISGRLTGPDGQAVSGAMVEALFDPGNGSPLAGVVSTETDGAGSYTFNRLGAGSYRIKFLSNIPGTIIEEFYGQTDIAPTGVAVTVVPGQVANSINFRLKRPATVGGNVWGSQFYPSVDLLDMNGRLVQRTHSDGRGRFGFGNIYPGNYRVAFAREDGSADEVQYYDGKPESAGMGSGAVLSLAEGTSTNLNGATLRAGGRVTGSVVGPDGKPLVNAMVQAFTDGGVLVARSATTDQFGGFSISGLSTGNYKLVANPDGRLPGIGSMYLGDTRDATAARSFAAAPGALTEVGVISYAPPAPTPSLPGLAVSIPPTRFLDTRNTAKVGPGGSVSFTIAGANGVPADASAVVMNITVTEPSSFGFVTAHASGTPKPNASNLNYATGQTVPNLAVVPIGADGKVTLSNTSSGSVQLIADVAAYYRGGVPSVPGAFQPISPSRFLDTRTASRVGPGGSVAVQVAGTGGVPANAAAVVMNVTVTEPSSFGFITAYASGSAKPNASNVNYAAGQTVPNLVVVPVGADGKVILSNTSSGSVQIIGDVSGYFLPGTATEPGAFGKIAPTRFLDTRTSSGPVAGGSRVSFAVAGVKGVPANVAGVWVNLTVTETQSFGFLTGFASGSAKPNASNVNYAGGQTVPNLAYLPVGADGRVSVANTSSGTAQIIADVSGYVLK
ncbi:carboxypeptidase regulatory-like domain-containing protein [Arthrobacter sp. M4]|uniref:carboxypeptidase regulatory-like domain-containing protein n=1 Tax=Arthrobacter sp. M4 TaxID=218160 RepID=UPI001CDC6E1D|nr:carboxypeptidase regulatory-like domain-containing protein [Arthrobacter sp. M4]MCA4133049.1 carboxypeptidase-like regulatory domain-containing protein [Arthrobacter sp. M4]